MKKLLVALTMVIFVVGLVLPGVAAGPPAIEDGYAEVYEWTTAGWVLLDVGDRECELYLQGSQHEQYRWESDPNAVICTGPPYLPPHPEPLQSNDLLIQNFVHYFPWIEMTIYNNEAVWDVFKPGDYMGKVFMLYLQANCPILIHFGSGTFPAPLRFEMPDAKDGKIISGDVTIPDTLANSADNKWWQYSMLKDTSIGTPPDEIEVMYWWEEGTVDDWLDPHHVTTTVPDKTNVVDSPKGPFPDGWVKAPGLNCDYTIIPDSVDLHAAKYIMFYEDINVKACESEGKYFDEFVITIVPDP